jgi:hypothetical protein
LQKKQIHPTNNTQFNHDMQLKIVTLNGSLQKIEANMIPNDEVEGSIKVSDIDLSLVGLYYQSSSFIYSFITWAISSFVAVD